MTERIYTVTEVMHYDGAELRMATSDLEAANRQLTESVQDFVSGRDNYVVWQEWEHGEQRRYLDFSSSGVSEWLNPTA